MRCIPQSHQWHPCCLFERPRCRHGSVSGPMATTARTRSSRPRASSQRPLLHRIRRDFAPSSRACPRIQCCSASDCSCGRCSDRRRIGHGMPASFPPPACAPILKHPIRDVGAFLCSTHMMQKPASVRLIDRAGHSAVSCRRHRSEQSFATVPLPLPARGFPSVLAGKWPDLLTGS